MPKTKTTHDQRIKVPKKWSKIED